MSIKTGSDFAGNTHGSMLEANGRFYIFAHRQTNKCQFSRQGFAEEVFIEEDGSIKQAERTLKVYMVNHYQEKRILCLNLLRFKSQRQSFLRYFQVRS